MEEGARECTPFCRAWLLAWTISFSLSLSLYLILSSISQQWFFSTTGFRHFPHSSYVTRENLDGLRSVQVQMRRRLPKQTITNRCQAWDGEMANAVFCSSSHLSFVQKSQPCLNVVVRCRYKKKTCLIVGKHFLIVLSIEQKNLIFHAPLSEPSHHVPVALLWGGGEIVTDFRLHLPRRTVNTTPAAWRVSACMRLSLWCIANGHVFAPFCSVFAPMLFLLPTLLFFSPFYPSKIPSIYQKA